MKNLTESDTASRARLVTVLGAVTAALSPYAGLVLGAIVAGPSPAGPWNAGTLVALVAVVAGYFGLHVATRSWPVAFKIVVVVAYTLFLGYTLFVFGLMLACELYRSCI